MDGDTEVLIHPTGDTTHDIRAVREEAKQLVERDYDLGRIVEIVPVAGGFMNWSFKVVTEHGRERKQYFVRKYNRATGLSEIELEHRLVTHVAEKGLRVAASVLASRTGSTWVEVPEPTSSGSVPRYYSVFDFLDGEAKYSWCYRNIVTAGELPSCAKTLADYHYAVRDFDAQGLGSGKPPIMSLLDTLPAIYRRLAANAGESDFDRLYLGNLERILACIQASRVSPAKLASLPSLVCHGDFHAGNMKYRDDQVVALFDFDFCHVDQRLFDLGHALHFFCFSWRPEDDGAIDLGTMSRFLGAYQGRAEELGKGAALSRAELDVIPEFMHAGNLFTLNWDIQDYYEEVDRDVDEYAGYLQHNLRMMETIDRESRAIRQVILESCGA